MIFDFSTKLNLGKHAHLQDFAINKYFVRPYFKRSCSGHLNLEFILVI